MDTRKILKWSAELIVTAGVGIIIDAAIERVLPYDMKRVKKIAAKVGGLAIIGVVSQAASDRTDELIDSFFDGFEKGQAIRERLLEPQDEPDVPEADDEDDVEVHSINGPTGE